MGDSKKDSTEAPLGVFTGEWTCECHALEHLAEEMRCEDCGALRPDNLADDAERWKVQSETDATAEFLRYSTQADLLAEPKQLGSLAELSTGVILRNRAGNADPFVVEQVEPFVVATQRIRISNPPEWLVVGRVERASEDETEAYERWLDRKEPSANPEEIKGCSALGCESPRLPGLGVCARCREEGLAATGAALRRGEIPPPRGDDDDLSPDSGFDPEIIRAAGALAAAAGIRLGERLIFRTNPDRIERLPPSPGEESYQRLATWIADHADEIEIRGECTGDVAIRCLEELLALRESMQRLRDQHLANTAVDLDSEQEAADQSRLALQHAIGETSPAAAFSALCDAVGFLLETVHEDYEHDPAIGDIAELR